MKKLFIALPFFGLLLSSYSILSMQIWDLNTYTPPKVQATPIDINAGWARGFEQQENNSPSSKNEQKEFVTVPLNKSHRITKKISQN